MQRVLAVREPLGALVPGPRPLEGKSFYLDEVKSHSCGVLTKLIVRLGGKVESFLYKDVNVVITGNRDALIDITASSGKVKVHDAAQRQGTPRAPVCGSRGKALLEKAIRNNEQSRGGVLSSAARYWGVKIVSVDQFLKVVEELNSQRSTHTHTRRRTEEEKSWSDCSTVRVKAGSLKVDFVKVEDVSRRYRPLHAQSLELPKLSYTRRFSPFENPAPVQPGKTRDDELGKEKSRKSDEPISSQDKATPSPKLSHRKKSMGYCECCQIKYKDQDQHLQSDVHQRFVEDVNNYAVVDQLVSAMEPVFSGCRDPHSDAPMTRSSSVSVAPPSEMEEHREPEMETCRTNQAAEPPGNVEVSHDGVCDSPVLLQEPREPHVDAPPYTFLETEIEDSVILDSKPVKCSPPSPGPWTDGLKHSTLQELGEICPRTLASPEASLTLKSPKHYEGDTMIDGPSCARLMVREQTPLEDATSCPPSFHSLTFQSFHKKLSDGMNPRKRSRSFTLSPKASKMRRTNLWSDPTNQNSSVSVRFEDVQINVINGDTDANDVTRRELETAEQDPVPNVFLTNTEAPEEQNDQQVYQMDPDDDACDVSSELGPPQLYPFFHDDVCQNQPPFHDPPTLTPSVAIPSTNNPSSGSLLYPSMCIESALVPDTFSPASSESDWDSGLLSRLEPPVHLQPKGGRCELDLGLLLQSSCAGVQDGSYASRLCSVLQPTAPSSHSGFGDPSTIYRPIETMDRRIIQSLGV